MNDPIFSCKYLVRTRRIALRFGLALLTTAPVAPLWMPAPIWAQQEEREETDPAPSSQLAKIILPAGAVRVRAVPAEIQEALAKFVSAAGLKQGESEMLAWRGGDYSKAKAPKLLANLKTALGKGKWKLETNDSGKGFQILTIAQPGARVLLGIWVPADEAAILAWSEVFKADAAELDTSEPQPEPQLETPDEEPAWETPPPRPRPQTQPQTNAPTPAGAIVRDVDANTKVVNVMGRNAPKTPTFPKIAPKKGFVRGYVKDGAGKPLANAKLGVRSTAVGGAYSGAQGKTDAQGYYEIAVPFGAAHFYNAGYSVNYGDGRVALGLHPADGELSSFASNVGGVENFVLRGYGIADEDDAQDQPHYAGNYYGGTIAFDWQVEDDRPIFATGKYLPPNSQIEITLTPQGALLDGSRGQSIVIRKRIGTFFGQLYATNIPSGTYRLNAKIVGGGALKLRETGPYSNRPFGLTPKESDGAATFQMRPGTAKADMVVGGKGGWDAVSVSLSR